HGRIEGLRDDHGRLGYRERGHLIDRHLRPVRLHVDAIKQADGGAAGAHARHFTADTIDGAVHARLDLGKHPFQIVEVHTGYTETVVPTASPCTTRRMLPGSRRSNTTI